MKKATTYYFLLLLGLNAFFAWYMTFADGVMRKTLHEALGGAPLPLWTQRFLDYHWWPWLAALASLSGVMTSLSMKVSDRVLRHVLVCFLILELWLMFTVSVALVAPWVTCDRRIGP